MNGACAFTSRLIPLRSLMCHLHYRSDSGVNPDHHPTWRDSASPMRPDRAGKPSRRLEPRTSEFPRFTADLSRSTQGAESPWNQRKPNTAFIELPRANCHLLVDKPPSVGPTGNWRNSIASGNQQRHPSLARTKRPSGIPCPARSSTLPNPHQPLQVLLTR